jgi:hypothetical protein
MPISKIKTSSITADAASINLNIDANTLFLDVANNRVGVGHTSPGASLDVRTSTASNYTGVFYNTSATGQGVTIRAGSTSSQDTFNCQTYDGGLSLFKVGADGKVGIGETSPTQILHLKGSSTTYGLAETTGTGTSSGFRMKAGASADYTLFTTQGVNQFAIYDNVAGSQRLTITSAGDLVLGSATSLSTSAGRTDFTINGSSNSLISFGIGGTRQGYLYAPSSGMILTSETGVLNLQTTAAHAIYLTTNNSERMRIDSSGNLLVGTTSAVDSSKMQVVGVKGFSSGIPQGQLNVADSTAYAAGVGGAIAFGGKYHSAGFYTTFASIEGNKENSTDNHYDGNLVIRVRSNGGDNVERMRISALNNTIRLYSGTAGASPALCFGSESDVSKKAIFAEGYWLVLQGHVNEGIRFQTTNGAGTITTRMTINGNGSVSIPGSLSKGSGSFRIEHPLPEKSETHELVHSFIEGPQADLIYRGKVNLVAGTSTVNIDTASGMTEGTFEVLCRDVQCFTTNESDWTAVRGSVTGNILTIEAQDNTSTASISWMVIGERKDKHMYDTEWTDAEGKVIVEPLKVEPEEIAPTETE